MVLSSLLVQLHFNISIHCSHGQMLLLAVACLVRLLLLLREDTTFVIHVITGDIPLGC